MEPTTTEPNPELHDSPEYEIPDYTLPANRSKYESICKELGIYDQDKMIFDNLISYTEEKDPPVNFHEFCVFLQNKSLPGLTLSVNVETYARRVINRLVSYKYIKMRTGNSENPGDFFLTSPYDLQAEQFEQEAAEVGPREEYPLLEKVKEILNSHYQTIADTQKVDIPFPTKTFIVNKMEKDTEDKNKLHELWSKGVVKIKCDDFNSKFIQQSSHSHRLIQIDFDEENHILLTPESERGLFQNVLAQKVMQYVVENPGIQDRIKLVLKKNQKEPPSIQQIFQSIGDEASFFWILTFKKIMEYLHQQKREQSIYLHFYEAACLLYQYSLFQREQEQQDQSVRMNIENFKSEFSKAMILNYAEPWNIDMIVAWHQRLPKPLLLEKLTGIELEGIVGSINEFALKNQTITPILTIKHSTGNYYFHKYRFCQLFLILLQKESINLKNHYIQAWSEQPGRFNDDAAFDADIEKNISELFHIMLTRVAPEVFSHKNPAESLFPDMVIIKQEKYQDLDLSDPQRQKTIYDALTTSLFTKKFSLDTKPLHKLFGLDQKILLKTAREYALRNIPFYRRGIIGALFGWFFSILEALAKNEEIKTLANKAMSLDECSALIEKYRPTKYSSVAKQQANRRKQEIMDQQRNNQQQSKDDSDRDLKESAEKRRERIEGLKKYFFGDESPVKRLAELEKQWNHKIGAARADTTNNVNNAVLTVMRRTRRFKATREEIEILADRVTKDPAFAEIINKSAFKSYIAVFIFNKLLTRID